jgi:UDP-N-acetylmuramoylalanine--D-glutamate ligase
VNYKEFFNQKRVAVIGLGPHGEMVSDIKFLLRNKSSVALYDIRSEKRFKGFLPELKGLGLTTFSFGKIEEDSLLNFDLILLSGEISKKSLFLKKAIQAEIQIEYPETLFFKLSPPITLIGVMGSYGKTTVTNLIHTILKKTFSEYKDQGLFLIDPDSSQGALTHLKKIKKDDVVIVRIPEYFLQYYYEIHISPHVAVITSLIDFDILDFQTYNNFIVATDEVVDALKQKRDLSSKAKILRTRANIVPIDWKTKTRAIHDKENIALVIQTAELFKATSERIRDVIQESVGPKSCLEFVKKVTGIEFYNDACSINPKSTLSALRSVSSGRNTILILGGAYTGHDYSDLLRNISQYTSTVILLYGSGSLGIRPELGKISDITVLQALTLEDAVKIGKDIAKKGEIVLFSPGFDAVGVDISRKERGEKFVKAVRGI